MPEFQPEELDIGALTLQRLLLAHVHGYQSYDCRRYWALWSVWFNGVPFMLLQNAGREGDDHAERFVTNLPVYKDAVTLVGTYRTTPEATPESYDGILDVEGVEKFYGDYLRPTNNDYH